MVQIYEGVNVYVSSYDEVEEYLKNTSFSQGNINQNENTQFIDEMERYNSGQKEPNENLKTPLNKSLDIISEENTKENIFGISQSN